MNNYKHYLQSDHWKKFRKFYFARKKPKGCQFCRFRDPLQLHHITYERLGHERLEDVVAICDSCHEEVHDLHNSGKSKNLRAATESVRLKYKLKKKPKPKSPLIRTSKGKARKRAYNEASDKRMQMDDDFVNAVLRNL